MPERFEIYTVYKRRYINTLPLLSFYMFYTLVTYLPFLVQWLKMYQKQCQLTRQLCQCQTCVSTAAGHCCQSVHTRLLEDAAASCAYTSRSHCNININSLCNSREMTTACQHKLQQHWLFICHS